MHFFTFFKVICNFDFYYSPKHYSQMGNLLQRVYSVIQENLNS